MRCFDCYVLSPLVAGAAFFMGSALAQTPADARTGEFFLVDDEGGRTRQALHLKTDVTMAISGMTNRVVLRQSFTNDTNDWQEGIYVFPLPEDSAVNAMKMLLDEREIVGDIRERAEARRVYEQARSEGKRAALVEQQRPNLFMQKIANIAPGETVSVELQYIQALRYDEGHFSLRFPMTLTPRYIPGVPLNALPVNGSFASGGHGWAIPTSVVPDAGEITPPYNRDPAGNTITMTIRLDAGLPLANVDSPTHEMATTPRTNGPLELHFRNTQVRMDRDFELQWTPEAGTAPQAAAFVDSRAEGTFMQVMLLPPRIEEPLTRLGREVIIVLDSSGSMEGTSIVQAKQSVELALGGLRDGDYFNIVDFDSTYQTLFSSSMPATPDSVDQARRFVQGLQADGGTEMLPALQFALTAPPAINDGAALLKQIVFITDGSVGNEEQLFALIRSELDDARLFTVGIGSAPNSYFMRKAAESGRGTFIHIQDTAQVAQRMDTLLRKLENAVMTNLSVEWPRGVSAEYYPATIPDLYLGEPLFVTARVEGNVASQRIRIAGTIAGRDWDRELIVDTVNAPGSTSGKPVSASSLASYWARQKMEALFDAALSRTANDEAAKTRLRSDVLAVALPYQLMSPYTSFVAVENRIARPVNRALNSGTVGNEPPAGQTLAAQLAAAQGMQQVSYPGTATPADLLIATAFVTLVCGVLLRWPRSRKRVRYAQG